MFPSDSSILVASDLSSASLKTLRHVLECVRDNQSTVRLLHVVEPMSDDARVTLMMFMQDANSRKKALEQRLGMMRKEFEKNLEDLWAAMPEEDQVLRQRIVATDIIEGYPAEVILQQAKKHNCDMVALGAHEQGIDHTFLGSVAKRVLRRSEIPTLIVPYRRER